MLEGIISDAESTELNKIADIAIKGRLGIPPFIDSVCVKCGTIALTGKKIDNYICEFCKNPSLLERIKEKKSENKNAKSIEHWIIFPDGYRIVYMNNDRKHFFLVDPYSMIRLNFNPDTVVYNRVKINHQQYINRWCK